MLPRRFTVRIPGDPSTLTLNPRTKLNEKKVPSPGSENYIMDPVVWKMSRECFEGVLDATTGPLVPADLGRIARLQTPL